MEQVWAKLQESILHFIYEKYIFGTYDQKNLSKEQVWCVTQGWNELVRSMPKAHQAIEVPQK